MKTAIIIVDHGSRLAESNELLEKVARAFAERFGERYPIVEPAHMEISSPSIAEAYAKCVARGATEITVVPYFLGPGKHMREDIPRLSHDAASGHPGTKVRVAPCLGLDEALLDLMARRIEQGAGVP